MESGNQVWLISLCVSKVCQFVDRRCVIMLKFFTCGVILCLANFFPNLADNYLGELLYTLFSMVMSRKLKNMCIVHF